MSLNTCVNCGIRFTSDERFDTACQLCLAKCEGDPETFGLPKQVRAGLALMKRYEAENTAIRAQVAAAKEWLKADSSDRFGDSVLLEDRNARINDAREAFRKLVETA